MRQQNKCAFKNNKSDIWKAIHRICDTRETNLQPNRSDFLTHLSDKMKTPLVRHTRLLNKQIKTVALCGGAGSFLLNDAILQKADCFITGDYKYHQFFDAENELVIMDVGHYESEQFTVDVFSEILTNKFSNFALLFSRVNTNPVKYFING